ncbi:MAG: L-seryl-tRNA(Sec) selenium transferase [Syntrophobacterales bacterium]|nr:L-seryl-tRNA(Sec) selenium transferase [Syntrophobacterales bacterium]
MDDTIKKMLQTLPKIDEILLILEKENIFDKAPRDLIVQTCRGIVKKIRDDILTAGKDSGRSVFIPTVEKAADEVKKKIERLHTYSLRRVVNATGIILHTNLGRAPLCEEALKKIVEISRGYSNLEFDLSEGKRGLRYDHVQEILCALTSAEDAMVVNNNAAAVLLVLNTLSEGKETIVSRGELIEIGGEFRIPEVMGKSGAILREVGTTNRTHLPDYERATGENTGLILKVHTSNFRIAGFTEDVELSSLVELGKNTGIPVMNDLGSGCFVELGTYGFEKEPTVQDALKAGVDVVTFSGDKLLGGPQAGIILGRKNILEKVKKNPLNRALRIDKLTLAALEATMKQYLNMGKAISCIKGLESLTEPVTAVEKRALKLSSKLKGLFSKEFTFSLKKGYSMAGGGSLPTQEIPTVLIAIDSLHLSAGSLGAKLRCLKIPIIARISDEEVLLDLRTIDETEFDLIGKGLKSIDIEVNRDDASGERKN